MPDDGAVLLPAPGLVVAPVLVEALLHKRAVLVVLEVLDNRIGSIGQEIGIFLLACCQPQVNQVGRGMIANGVPVLARLVLPQCLVSRIERQRVDVGEVAAFLTIAEELVEQIDGHLGVAQDAGIAGHAKGLYGTRQRVDLLVSGNSIVIIAKLRGENFALATAAYIHRVIPVDDFFVCVNGAHVLAQVLRALFRGFQVAIFACEQVSRGKAVDHARDGIGLLARAFDLLSLERQVRAIVAVIDHAVGELRVEIEIGQCANLLHPPVGRFKAIFIVIAPGQDDVLGFEAEITRFRVEDTAGEQVPARCQQTLQRNSGILKGFSEVAHQFRVGCVRQFDLKLPVTGCFQGKGFPGLVNRCDIARYGI